MVHVQYKKLIERWRVPNKSGLEFYTFRDKKADNDLSKLFCYRFISQSKRLTGLFQLICR